MTLRHAPPRCRERDTRGGSTTWYGLRVRYLLQPVPGFSPDYTSWVLVVSAATGATPGGLASAPESSLGGLTTAARWAANPILNNLATSELAGCFWNNPIVHAEGGKLYLVSECQIYSAGNRDKTLSKISVFSTTPSGAPSTWAWSYAGSFAGGDIAAELGTDVLEQPDVSLAPDGRRIVLFSPSTVSGANLQNTGCIALSLQSIDPLTLERDCAGTLKVLGSASIGVGGECTYDPSGSAGVIVNQTLPESRFTLEQTALRP